MVLVQQPNTSNTLVATGTQSSSGSAMLVDVSTQYVASGHPFPPFIIRFDSDTIGTQDMTGCG